MILHRRVRPVWCALYSLISDFVLPTDVENALGKEAAERQGPQQGSSRLYRASELVVLWSRI